MASRAGKARARRVTLAADIRDEREGTAHYRQEARTARAAGQPRTARTLRRLSHEERGHLSALRKLRRKGTR